MPVYEINTAELGPCWVAADSLDEALSLTAEWAMGYSATGRSVSFSAECAVCGEHPVYHDEDREGHPFTPKEERCIYVRRYDSGPSVDLYTVTAIRELTGKGLKEVRDLYLRAGYEWVTVPLPARYSTDYAVRKLAAMGLSVERSCSLPFPDATE